MGRFLSPAFAQLRCVLETLGGQHFVEVAAAALGVQLDVALEPFPVAAARFGAGFVDQLAAIIN